MTPRQQWLVAKLGCAGMLLLLMPVAHADLAPSKKEEPFHYDAHGKRDPFTPLVRGGIIVGAAPSTKTSSTTPVLYGIVWDPSGQSIALINDGEVRVGQEIDGYKVREIRQDAVVLSNGGEPLVLRIIFDAEPTKRAPRGTTGGKHR